MIVTIDAQVIRSAMQCQAKDDVRYLFNGVLLRADGAVIGTNAYILFKCPGAFEAPEGFTDTIVHLPRTIPVRVTQVGFDFDYKIATYFLPKGAPLSEVFQIIDGQFPDVERIIPKDPYTKGTTLMAFNPEYLALIPKVFPYIGVRVNIDRDVKSPIVVRPNVAGHGPMDDALMLIMQMML